MRSPLKPDKETGLSRYLLASNNQNLPKTRNMESPGLFGIPPENGNYFLYRMATIPAIAGSGVFFCQ